MNTQGTLYIVATPIGNLQDMSARAISVLNAVDVIACEDTRHSVPLLKEYGIDTPYLSLHAHNEKNKSEQLLERLLHGESVAVISDAGTPLINDPGYDLVKLCEHNAIHIVPVPGACALIAALSVSGLPADRFSFEGFIPAKSVARQKLFESLKRVTQTVIYYEAPHRIIASLQDMMAVYGEDREVVVARELTKTFEEVMRGTLSSLILQVTGDPNKQRGEFVVLVKGQKNDQDETIQVSERTLLSILLEDLPVRQAVSMAVKMTGRQKNHLYDLALKLKSESDLV